MSRYCCVAKPRESYLRLSRSSLSPLVTVRESNESFAENSRIESSRAESTSRSSCSARNGKDVSVYVYVYVLACTCNTVPTSQRTESGGERARRPATLVVVASATTPKLKCFRCLLFQQGARSLVVLQVFTNGAQSQEPRLLLLLLLHVQEGERAACVTTRSARQPRGSRAAIFISAGRFIPGCGPRDVPSPDARRFPSILFGIARSR